MLASLFSGGLVRRYGADPRVAGVHPGLRGRHRTGRRDACTPVVAARRGRADHRPGLWTHHACVVPRTDAHHVGCAHESHLFHQADRCAGRCGAGRRAAARAVLADGMAQRLFCGGPGRRGRRICRASHPASAGRRPRRGVAAVTGARAAPLAHRDAHAVAAPPGVAVAVVRGGAGFRHQFPGRSTSPRRCTGRSSLPDWP